MVINKLKRPGVLLFATLLISCETKVPTKQELIGRWQDERGGVLVLEENNTFTGNKLSANELAETVFPPSSLQNQTVSFYQGKWKLICDYDHCNVVFLINKPGSESGVYSVPFIARGEGLLNAGKIDRLERWLDPDGLDVYELKRIHVANN